MPTSGDGAAIGGGRFNRKGTAALYLSLTIAIAIREANQAFANKLQPCVLCSYEVDCEDIVEIATKAGRRNAGVAYDDLAAAWLDYLISGREPPQ